MYPTIRIPIRYEIAMAIRIRVCIPNDIASQAYLMYRGRIPCIPIQSSILQYCDICVSDAETRLGCTTWQKFQIFSHFFMYQFWSRVKFCMTRQKIPNLPGFLGSGLCDPSDIASEPFYIQEFCFVTYQLIYSQKPLTFSSFTAFNTYTHCFSTLYTLYV